MSADAAESTAPEPAGPIAPASGSSGRAQAVVRRIIVFVILFSLVVVAATGIIGLIEQVFAAGRVIVDDDAALARSLAFTLIGGPLAGILWWWERRKLADPAERASVVWALYLTAMSLTALIAASVAFGDLASAGIAGEWRPGDLAAGIVWLGVWVWHRHMRRSAATAPSRLADLPVELAALYGLVLAAWSVVTALAALISEALAGVAPVIVASQSWVVPLLQALAWSAIGVLVWWWHWFRERAMDAPGAFAAVLLVIVIGGSAAASLFAIGTILFVLLRLLFDTDSIAEVIEPLDTAIAAALIAGILWTYHVERLAGRSARVRSAARLVISAVALIGAASGFGVTINALLATLTTTLLDDDPRTLLLGGISALVVGAPVWWIAWRPAADVSEEQAADPARRVYLVAVFGASAIVAIITLLTIGYRLFEFLLDPGAPGGLVELIRAPLGLLSATALVFGYHFAVWRRDRAAARTVIRVPTVGRVILVAGDEADAAAERIRAETGAAVKVWRAADAAAALSDDELASVLAALGELTAPRVLVIAGSDGGSRVVPLAD